MIQINNLIDCCGCNACGDACVFNAIIFKTDIEGFWYPEVNMDKCTNCGLCEKVCPIINIKKLKKNDYEIPIKTFAAINKKMIIRWDSTSGGVFSALAEGIYEQGGYVGGALYNKDFSVSGFISNDPKDLKRLRGSKYLQSNNEGFFCSVKEAINTGKEVLVCGTPCQMAALRSFLSKDYANLVIVDFICRGVNSPKVYRKYLDSLEIKYNSTIVDVKAKNKELGWRNLTRKVTFANGDIYYGVLMDDDYRRGYHTNVFCRPSCYECKFKGLPRIADISLGDFWGIEKVDPNLDNNVGTSTILINSDRGKSYFNHIKDKLQLKETQFEATFGGNAALFRSIEPAKIDRKKFFEELDSDTFDNVSKKYFPLSTYKNKLFGTIKRTILPYYSIFMKLRFSLKAYKNFIWLNLLRKNTKADFSSGKVIYTMPSTYFDIHPTAKINIDYGFNYGISSVKGMQIPTCLRMEENTTFNIHDGPLTRYGKGPYNLRYGAYIEVVNGGTLTIGQGAANVGLTIMCAKSVTIGNGVRIGRNVSIRDWNGPHVIINDHYRNEAPVEIGDHCWLGTGCTIMPGVTIGEGSVIAANSLVLKDVPPHSMVAGSPARIVNYNVEWY